MQMQVSGVEIRKLKKRFWHTATHEVSITMSSKKMGNQPPNGQSQDNTSKPGSGRTSKDLGHRDPAAEEKNVNKTNTVDEEPEESSMFSGLDVNDGDGDRANEKEEGSISNAIGENNEDGNDSSMFEYVYLINVNNFQTKFLFSLIESLVPYDTYNHKE